ncbi:MAG: hypothetical protein E7402_03350 [Ruminococcaceae bacterium]|nr:hypothetical protein [Oscillospiraceae bacterium]
MSSPGTGLDTFTNLASIPVDLARGDYVSAGLSALGVVPVVGEVADTAKLAKVADKAVDTAKRLHKDFPHFRLLSWEFSIGKNKTNQIGRQLTLPINARLLSGGHFYVKIVENF